MHDTIEDIFYKVARHLLEQGKRSCGSLPDQVGKGESCLYRDGHGASCAVGCLINDSAYSAELEGNSVRSSDVVEYALKASGVDTTEDVLEMLLGLQRVHDTIPAHHWRAALCGFGFALGFRPYYLIPDDE